jgi:hypothetical protein
MPMSAAEAPHQSRRAPIEMTTTRTRRTTRSPPPEVPLPLVGGLCRTLAQTIAMTPGTTLKWPRSRHQRRVAEVRAGCRDGVESAEHVEAKYCRCRVVSRRGCVDRPRDRCVARIGDERSWAVGRDRRRSRVGRLGTACVDVANPYRSSEENGPDVLKPHALATFRRSMSPLSGGGLR